MNRIKKFIKNGINKKYIPILVVVIILLFGVFTFFIAHNETNKTYKEKQAACEHDWKELCEYDIGYFEIYCPKCQLQECVSTANWNKIQIDMEYQSR